MIYVAIAGLTITFLAQFGGIIWFASSLRAAVTQLIGTTRELRATVESLERYQVKIDKRLVAIEALQRQERA